MQSSSVQVSAIYTCLGTVLWFTSPSIPITFSHPIPFPLTTNNSLHYWCVNVDRRLSLVYIAIADGRCAVAFQREVPFILYFWRYHSFSKAQCSEKPIWKLRMTHAAVSIQYRSFISTHTHTHTHTHNDSGMLSSQSVARLKISMALLIVSCCK